MKGFVRTNQRVQIDWDQINWSQVKHQVEITQQKIFRDTQTGNFRAVTQFQKLLVSPIGGGLVT